MSARETLGYFDDDELEAELNRRREENERRAKTDRRFKSQIFLGNCDCVADCTGAQLMRLRNLFEETLTLIGSVQQAPDGVDDTNDEAVIEANANEIYLALTGLRVTDSKRPDKPKKAKRRG